MAVWDSVFGEFPIGMLFILPLLLCLSHKQDVFIVDKLENTDEQKET